MADDAAPGAGNVPIMLNGVEHQLVPTLGACMAISGIAGGLNAAVQRCVALDFVTICQVIEAGMNLNPTQAKKLREEVYAAGLINLFGPCIDFIQIVANGGRPPPAAEDGDHADPPRPASP